MDLRRSSLDEEQMITKRTVRIVLSSPNDVQPERQVMEKVIDELNGGIADDRGLCLELSRWETDAYPGFHAEGPQGIIDPILKIEDCDVLLGIFWRRFGTPTKHALSGTEHEIRAAIESFKKRGRPQIMMYFKETDFFPRTREEIAQFGLVLQFREDFPKEGLYWTFKEEPEKGTPTFERLVLTNLTNFIKSRFPLPGAELVSSSPTTDDQTFVRYYSKAMRQRFSTIYFFGRRRASDDERAGGAGAHDLHRTGFCPASFARMA